MAKESIISATCSVQHDRRLFRLHNYLVDRPVLGYGVRGLRFIGMATSDVDQSTLRCRFRVLNTDSQRFVSTYKVSDFAGIDFSLEATEPAEHLRMPSLGG